MIIEIGSRETQFIYTLCNSFKIFKLSNCIEFALLFSVIEIKKLEFEKLLRHRKTIKVPSFGARFIADWDFSGDNADGKFYVA